jgi:GAF domain-containing protein
VAQDRESDPEALEVVGAVAEQLSAHLEGLRLTEQREQALAETEEQAKRLTRLNELGQALASASTLDDIYAIIARNLAQIVPSERTSIAVMRETGDRFEVLALRGDKGAKSVGDIVLARGSALGTAILEDRLVVIGGTTDTGIPGIKSFMVAPLRAGGRTFGTLNVGRRVAHAYNQADQRLLLQVASLLAASIESQRLLEQVEARARRERILREVTATVRGTADVDSIMRKAAQEVGRALGRQAFVFLGDSEKEEEAAKPLEES